MTVASDRVEPRHDAKVAMRAGPQLAARDCLTTSSPGTGRTSAFQAALAAIPAALGTIRTSTHSAAPAYRTTLSKRLMAAR